MNEEEELKEEVDRYERQNQEAYDLEIENEIKRKREAQEKYKQLPLFSRLNDAIEGKINQFGQFVADAAEDKPGISDDIVRGGLRGLQFVGNLPVIKQIGQLEEGIVGGVRNLAERQNLIDPRTFTYGTRIGLAFAGDKGVRKVVKVGQTAAKTRKINQLVKGKNILGQPLKAKKPIAGGLQEQFTSEGLKGVLLQSIDNPQNPLFDLSTYTTPVTEAVAKVARRVAPMRTNRQLQTQFPWEVAQGDPRIFRSNRSGPAPFNQYDTLVASAGKKQRQFFKGDIELNEFSFGTKGDKYNLDRFERRIQDLMETDRIEALNVPAGRFTAIPGKRKIPTTAATLKQVQNLYADYVAGFFNQHIAGGKEVDFSKLAKLTLDGNPVIDLTGKKKTAVLRELRLLEIDPTVYKSGAFNPSSISNVEKARDIIQEAIESGVKQKDDIYKVDLHHLDQVAEGFNLYKGLNRLERVKMRNILKGLGLNPGNHPKNVLRILNTDHVKLHKRYWPKAEKRLREMGFYDNRLYDLKTAEERIRFAEKYVEETKKAAKLAVERTEKTIERNIDKQLFPPKSREMKQTGRPGSVPKSG